MTTKRARRIVLTGGPGGGKTSALEVFRCEYPNRFSVIPEAATFLYMAGFPRFPDDNGRRAAQTAIFQVQRSLEDVTASHYGERICLCDRGTPDGAAYWPGGSEAFFQAQGTTQEKELARYDAVLYFETAAAGGLSIESANRTRIDTSAEAVALDQKVRAVYAPHPQFHVIEHQASYFRKIENGLRTLRAVLDRLG